MAHCSIIFVDLPIIKFKFNQKNYTKRREKSLKSFHKTNMDTVINSTENYDILQHCIQVNITKEGSMEMFR